MKRDYFGWFPGTIEQRFLKYVDKSPGFGPDGDCWRWTGRIAGSWGYGQFWRDPRHEQAHRVAYEMWKGPIPDGLLVLHSCHVTSCVNPAHLRPGTNDDNARDCVEAGREPRGEANGKSKITSAQVLEIRAQHAAGETCKSIAFKFGMSPQWVGRIVRGEVWKHLLKQNCAS